MIYAVRSRSDTEIEVRPVNKSSRRELRYNKLKRETPLFIMLIPGVVLLFIYNYLPMYGVVMAFQRFSPAAGLFGPQKWIGLKNFEVMFSNMFALRAMRNTVIIALLKIITIMLVPITVSILLNEVRSTGFKRSVQTAIYLPYFLSWVILGGILSDILAIDGGMVNHFLKSLGLKQISFLGSNDNFRGTIVVSNIWKEFGFATVMYMAAITGIDPSLYEAATVDGANRWQRIWHVTLPGMSGTIIILAVLNLGNVLNAGFDQIFNLYSPAVYETGDILDTYVYRLGLLDFQYGQATAVGLFKSVVSFIFISTGYWIAYKKFDYKVF